jgi:CRISPR type I-E-associated protein CasB/Cse2
MTTPEKNATAYRPEREIVTALSALRNAGDAGIHRLKRGTELLDAMMEPSFHAIKAKLQANRQYVNEDLLACAMLLLARMPENAGNTPFARKLGKSEYSTIRFTNLIRCEDPAELFTHLHRAVKFCDSRVCPFNLTKTVLDWTELRLPSARKRLISEFHGFG